MFNRNVQSTSGMANQQAEATITAYMDKYGVLITPEKSTEQVLAEFKAAMRRFELDSKAEEKRVTAYRIYNQAENDFIASHSEDKDAIKICFDWLHEHGINNDEMIEKVMQHYRKLAIYLSQFTIENRRRAPLENASFYTSLVNKFIALPENHVFPSVQPQPEAHEEKVPDNALQFRMNLEDLNKLISLSEKPLRFEEDFQLLLSARPNDQAYVSLTGNAMDAFVRVASVFTQFVFDDVRFHKDIRHQVLPDENRLNVEISLYDRVIEQYKYNVDRFRKCVNSLEEIKIGFQDEIPLMLSEKQFSRVANACEHLGWFRVQLVGAFTFSADKIPLPLQMLEKIKALFTEFDALMEEGREFAKYLFGTVAGEEVCNPGAHRQAPIKALYQVPADKAETLRDCYVLYTHESHAHWYSHSPMVAHWLSQWATQYTQIEARTLTSVYAWLNSNGFATMATCQLLTDHVKFVKPDQFHSLKLKDESNNGLKQFIATAYLENLQTQKQLSLLNAVPVATNVTSFSIFEQPPQQRNDQQPSEPQSDFRLGD